MADDNITIQDIDSDSEVEIPFTPTRVRAWNQPGSYRLQPLSLDENVIEYDEPKYCLASPVRIFSVRESPLDVIIKCGKSDDEVIHCQRLFYKNPPKDEFYVNSYVLKNISTVCSSLFELESKEKDNNTVSLSHINPSYLQFILELSFCSSKTIEVLTASTDFLQYDTFYHFQKILELINVYQFEEAKSNLSVFFTLSKFLEHTKPSPSRDLKLIMDWIILLSRNDFLTTLMANKKHIACFFKEMATSGILKLHCTDSKVEWHFNNNYHPVTKDIQIPEWEYGFERKPMKFSLGESFTSGLCYHLLMDDEFEKKNRLRSSILNRLKPPVNDYYVNNAISTGHISQRRPQN